MNKNSEYPSMALQASYNVLMNEKVKLMDMSRELLAMIEKCQHLGYCKAIRGPEDEQWIEEEKCDCGRNAVIAKAEAMLK